MLLGEYFEAMVKWLRACKQTEVHFGQNEGNTTLWWRWAEYFASIGLPALDAVKRSLLGQIKSFGVLSDIILPMEKQISAVSMSSQLHLTCKLAPYLDASDLAMQMCSTITSKLDYRKVFYVGLPLKTGIFNWYEM